MIWSEKFAVRVKLQSTSIIRFEQMPGSRKLFLDYLAGKTAEYFHYDFNSDDALRQVQERVSRRSYQRERIVAVLLRQNQAYGAGPRTIENIHRLLDQSTSAVFTGQQVTLCGGPLFVFYKAALAVKLAASNCRKLEGRVVPIFWMAADDADFDEVARLQIPTPENTLRELIYRPLGDVSGQPMGAVDLDAGINTLLDELEQALPQAEFRAELMTLLRRCYQPGTSIVTAFGRLMSQVFHDSGLIFVDPSDPEFREMALPVFRRELELGEQAAQLIEGRNRRLEAQGYHLQVARPGGYSNLFYYNGKRTRIDLAPDGFAIDGKAYNRAELAGVLERAPALFSPNVFLRAIVQSHIFPTLVYFAGPAEAAYFSQIRDLFELYGEEPPIIYPRFSATIIEPAIARLLEKLEIGVEQTFGDVNQLVNEILLRTFPGDFEQGFASLREEVRRRMDEIAARLDQSDHGLITNANRIAGKLDLEIKNLEEKVFQAHRKKNQTLRAQIERVGFNLYPNGKLQERSFPLIYYMAKYGHGIIDRLLQAVDCNSKVHHLIYLE